MGAGLLGGGVDRGPVGIKKHRGDEIPGVGWLDMAISLYIDRSCNRQFWAVIPDKHIQYTGELRRSGFRPTTPAIRIAGGRFLG